MVSVVEQGGFQFTVTEGDTIRVPSVDADEGKEISLDRVLLVRDGDAVKVGTPEVKGAKVRAKVMGNGKGPKVLVVKKKRREDYKRKNGHRQPFTRLQITSIKA
ncbi:MAG: 50S ribosomal protein L21 [Chitinivibrionales bacterium]|nr:50S ribosomal protein L21 [Chitinivibrionales bacterium]MBD3394687.1 50S ribosomal protein L21 [Chitinivibrionales bacterium]